MIHSIWRLIMHTIRNNYQNYISDFHTGEILFFTGYILYLGRGVWATTTFPLPGIISKLCLLLPIVFIGLKIILYDGYTIKPLLFIIVMTLSSLCVLYYTGYLNIFFWILPIIGSRHISFKKILKVYLLIVSAVVFLAFASSLLGVIENYKYIAEDRGIRQSFGIVYTTDFASHIFFITLTAYYLGAEHLNFYHHLLAIITAYLVYHFCNARLDSISILLTVMLFVSGPAVIHSQHMPRNLKKTWICFWKTIGPVFMPILAAASFVLTILYTESISILAVINQLLSNRLRLGQSGIVTHGIRPFGQAIDMIGAGGGLIWSQEYNFVDCSYINILLRYGIITIFIVLVTYVICCIKNRHDLYFLYTVALIALNCVIAHHLLELEYNPFALALFSSCARLSPKHLECCSRCISPKECYGYRQ